jgi:putative transposase
MGNRTQHAARMPWKERIVPGRPDQNGRHERMHSTLKAETARPPCSSWRAQQRSFQAFHSSLRPYPRQLPHPDYSAHFRIERTYPNGVISLRGTQWYLSNCLAGELVGLEELDGDRWAVYFGPIQLGILDVRNAKERGSRSFAVLVRTDGKITSRRRQRRR